MSSTLEPEEGLVRRHWDAWKRRLAAVGKPQLRTLLCGSQENSELLGKHLLRPFKI